MELSILVAKILALYYLAVGVGMLSGNINYKKLIDDFQKSQGLMLITGFFLLVLGVLLVDAHNIWVKDWTVLVTIIAWAILIKGVLLIAAPKVLFSFKGLYKNMKPSWGIFMIALGLLFGYFGFIV